MAVLRCTKKLLAELKMTAVEDIATGDMLGDWHANLLRIERRKCVLFTHSATLYCVLLTCMRKQDFEHIREEFLDQLWRNMRWDGFSGKQTELLMDAHLNIEFSRTNNRSVLGSMNDFANGTVWAIYQQGGIVNASPSAVGCNLNRTPMSAIGMKYPVDAMRAFLDSRLDVATD